MKHEAFVYLWQHKDTGVSYIGYHIGSQDDGYVSSSEEFNRIHSLGGFNRSILAVGTAAEMEAFETGWMRAIDARTNSLYVNKWNNDDKYTEKLEAVQHGRQLLEGKLEVAGIQPGQGGKSNQNFYVIYIDGTVVSCNPEFVKEGQDERLRKMDGKQVKATVTFRGGYYYFGLNNVNLKGD